MLIRKVDWWQRVRCGTVGIRTGYRRREPSQRTVAGPSMF